MTVTLKRFISVNLVVVFVSLLSCRNIQNTSSENKEVMTGANFNVFKCSNLSKSPLKGRFSIIVGAYKSEIVIFGGKDETRRFVFDGEVFDTATDTWSKIESPKFEIGKSGFRGAVVDGKLFVFGLKGAPTDSSYPLNTAAFYDLESRQWTEVSVPSNFTSLGSFVVAAAGSRIFIHGLGANYFRNARWSIFDPETLLWTEPKGGIMDTVGYPAVVEAKVYFLGDSYSGNRLLEIDSNQQKSLSLQNSGINTAAIAVGDNLVYWGGDSGTDAGRRDPKFSDKGGIYNTLTNQETKMPSSPFALRSFHGATFIGKKVIFWGGLGGSASYPDMPVEPLASGAVFDLDLNKWICN